MHLNPTLGLQMAASMNWGVLFVGVRIGTALVFGIYIKDPDCWKLPNGHERSYSCTSEPEVGAIYMLGALGI